jgi:NADH:ubiquinone oxidoreductase subunit 2 (subunit N)
MVWCLCLYIMVSMWLAEPVSDVPRTVTIAGRITLGVAVAITLVLGVLPTWLLDLGDSLTRLVR